MLESSARPPCIADASCSGKLPSHESSSVAFKQSWDFHDDSILISWDCPSRDDLLRWCAELSSDHRELLAVRRGLIVFRDLLQGQVVTVFCDNTAVSYLRCQGGTFSPVLNGVTQDILCWAESQGISLLPQFVPGRCNVVADALSRHHQALGSEWTLAQEVADELRAKWLVMVDCFATCQLSSTSVPFPSHQSHGRRDRCLSSELERASRVCLSLIFSDSASPHQTQVLQWDVDNSDCPLLASKGTVSRSFEALGGSSCRSSVQDRSVQTATLSSSSLEVPRASSSCLETLQQFAQHVGLSQGVVSQLSLCRHSSSPRLCQNR